MVRLPGALLMASCAVVATGCPPGERPPLDDWVIDTGDTSDTDTGDTDTDTDTGGDTDTAVPTAPIGLYGVLGLGYDVRLHANGDTAELCEIEIDGTIQGYQSLDCTLDINELDLFGNGLDFDFEVPFGACDYVVWAHYMYEAWEVGVGPADVAYRVDIAGNLIDEENTINGAPFCEYDYGFALDDAPNCCLGSYILTVTNDATGSINTVGPVDWGGNPADCYDGAAYYDPEAVFSADGWPLAKIVFLDQDSFEKRYHWDLLAAQYVSNIPLANYYDPADHDGTMPAGIAAEYARPHYLFQCYDHAEELLGQLRLTVQEWNVQDEFYSFGDPNTTGTEPVSGTPLDDRDDWATGTPGDDVWIQFGQ